MERRDEEAGVAHSDSNDVFFDAETSPEHFFADMLLVGSPGPGAALPLLPGSPPLSALLADASNEEAAGEEDCSSHYESEDEEGGRLMFRPPRLELEVQGIKMAPAAGLPACQPTASLACTPMPPPGSAGGQPLRGGPGPCESGGSSPGASGSSAMHTSQPSEACRILRLAAPLTVSNVGGYAIGMVAMAAVGHLGEEALSVVVLATSVYNMTGLSCLVGFASAMETFCGQAYGAGRYKAVGVVLQRALLLTLLLVAVVSALWTQTERALRVLGQDPRISLGCAEFLLRAAPALWFTGAFEALKRYLMAQEDVRPITAATLAALALAPLYNWLLIYRLGWGLHGAAYAMVAVQATTALLLATYCLFRGRRMRHHPKCTWGGWTSRACTGLGRYCRLALPSVAMLCCEWSMFQVMVVMSGWLTQPEVAVSAMGIVINTSGVAYMSVTGLACAVSVRVGTSLGAGHPWTARRATWAGWRLTMRLQVCVAAALLLARHTWARLFTNSEPVVEAVAALLPILALSIFGDGTSAVLQGLLRGGGKQALGALTNVASCWGVGIPLAYFLAIPRGLGLTGLWWGIALTNTMQGCIMATLSLCFNFPLESQRAVEKARHEAARLEAQRAAEAAGLVDSHSSSSRLLLERLLAP